MDRAALLERGAREFGAGALAAAAETYRVLLRAAPDDSEALSNLAGVLNAAQCHDAAEAACRAALAARPGYWAALANLATALHARQRHAEAVGAYVAAARANPGHAATWTNLGVALAEQGHMPGALAAHDVALSLAPDDPAVRLNRAMALLMAGDLAQGFAEFEWRHRGARSAAAPDLPRWQGDDPAGRTILLHEDGGFGDTLQFARYAPLLAARGARVVLRVQAPLLRLLRRSMGRAVTVTGDDGPPPQADLHCPLMSLPHAFGTTLDTVPATVPYLATDGGAVARWRAWLAGGGAALSVGLVWTGSPRLGVAEARVMNGRRSFDPARLAALAGFPGVRLVSLQHGAPAPRPAILDPMGAMQDFDDTAALVAALELVITVDTAVAHLAGALGRPVWVLSRFDGCWRWLAGRADSPWYPTLRLYRQPRPGDWDSVIAAVAADLADLPRITAP